MHVQELCVSQITYGTIYACTRTENLACQTQGCTMIVLCGKMVLSGACWEVKQCTCAIDSFA